MREIDRIAQEQFNGDMEKTLYALLFDGNLGGLDPHVDDLNQDEATFVYVCMNCTAVHTYGGEEIFKKSVKAEEMAINLDTTTDEARNCQCNPYRKKLFLEIGKLFGAILIPALVAFCLRKLGIGYEWIFSVQAILIGLCAMSTATAVLSIFRFRRLKKLLADIPQTLKEYVPTFDECIAHRQHMYASRKQIKPAHREDAETVLNAARKKNWIAIALLPVFVAVVLAANMVAHMGGSVKRTLGMATVLMFFFWQMYTIGRATIRTRDIVAGVPSQDPAYDRLNKRQQLCALAMMGIGGIYLIVAFAGCLSLLVN